MGAEHHVDPRGALAVIVARSFWARQPPTAICMPGRLGLDRGEVAEVAVELVVGVLPHGAGVEDDDVRILRLLAVGAVREGDVPRLLEQPGQPLGVVHVHLAPVGLDLVGARLQRWLMTVAQRTGLRVVGDWYSPFVPAPGCAARSPSRARPSRPRWTRYADGPSRCVGRWTADAGILLVARGSSDNAAVYGRYLVETRLGIPAALAAPSVATHYRARLDLATPSW